MMKDQFANYVIQKMLDVVDPDQKVMLIEKIRPHLPSLKKFTYGKHLITSMFSSFGMETHSNRSRKDDGSSWNAILIHFLESQKGKGKQC